MKKQEALRCESISFDEFIDIITENRGEEIKRKIREIEINSKPRNNKKVNIGSSLLKE